MEHCAIMVDPEFSFQLKMTLKGKEALRAIKWPVWISVGVVAFVSMLPLLAKLFLGP